MAINSTRTILLLLNILNSISVLGLDTDASINEKAFDEIKAQSIIREKEISIELNKENPQI